MAKFRVLALDGGGVRGIFTTMLLRRLASQPGLAHAFDHAHAPFGDDAVERLLKSFWEIGS